MKQRRQFLCSEMFHITEKDKSGPFPVSLSNGVTTPPPKKTFLDLAMTFWGNLYSYIQHIIHQPTLKTIILNSKDCFRIAAMNGSRLPQLWWTPPVWTIKWKKAAELMNGDTSYQDELIRNIQGSEFALLGHNGAISSCIKVHLHCTKANSKANFFLDVCLCSMWKLNYTFYEPI